MEQSLEAAIDTCQVPRESIENIYPCTPLQAGPLSLTARDASTYVGQWLYTLSREVDILKLGHA
jgi:hypothetical protein